MLLAVQPIFLVISCLLMSVLSKDCFWNSPNIYKKFSSKTPYNCVRGDMRDAIVKIKGCEPVSIWGIYRHGKRQPGGKFAENMRDVIDVRNYITASYEKGHSSLCAQDVENLQNWKLNRATLNGKRDITDEGQEEMIGLGKRLKEAFPGLLTDLQREHYTFRSALGPWIEKSIEYFVKGLGNKNIVIDDVKPDADVMAPYATCGSYQKNVQQNPQIYAEAEKYLHNSEYLVAKDRIQRRSGIEYTLSDENITALYDLCRYTWSAVDNKVSPWCALFTKDDLEVLEYIQDLRHYYRNGYGTPVNEIFGKVPLGNLLQSFESAKNGEGKKIVAYVTHATMLDQIYTALGLFKDSAVLTGASRNPERKWRTSKISVFSANLVAVLNRCTNHSEHYNVVFYLNEEPMRSICEEGVCSWREFENKLRPFINTTIDFCEFRNDPY